MSRRQFTFLYACSGAAALVYEVTWTRMLTLQLGHTVAAASIVLAAFMGGLAVGAWIAGTWSWRTLRAYAALEAGAAVCAILLPVALRAAVPALAWAYADGTAPVRFAATRLAISLVLVGIPAAAMGATFPVAAEWFGTGRSAADAAAGAGRLYAANTVGAALGAVGAGFWLIPAIGLGATTWIGVLLNAVAAGGALWLARNETTATAAGTAAPSPSRTLPARPRRSPQARQPQRPPSFQDPGPHNPLLPRLAHMAAAISGFSALVYEVTWTRLLALVLGPTTYAFATMAAAFISGLAIGSAVGARLARRIARPGVWLAAMLVVSSVAAVTTAWFAATRLPLIVAAQVADPGLIFGRLIAMQAFGIGIVLLPMSMALGATFPLALACASQAGQAGSTVGRAAARVYTANTLGAIAGALTAGFLLIPALGLQWSFRVAALCGAIAGAGCLAAATRSVKSRGLIASATVAVAATAAIVMVPRWDNALLASGAYKYAPYVAGGAGGAGGVNGGSGDFDAVLPAGRLEYYKEGAAGTVSVRRLTGTLSLAIDGKVDASNAGDMLTQRLLGLLPVLIHGHAQDLCIIGLGSGVTLDSALATHTVKQADVVEISPEVVAASHFFDRENGNALGRPGVRLLVGDGRSHLLLTRRRYDVIVSEPSNPWMAGVATLFTREFFEAARSRLKPDGLLCQWAHTYDISAEDLRSIVRTFASVFPEATMWLVGEGDLLLIGAADRPIGPRLDGLAAESLKGAAPDAFATVGIGPGEAPFDLLSLFAGGPRELERFGGQAVIQSDDRTALEYSAPRGIYGKTANDNAATIRGLGGEPPPAVRNALGQATDANWASRGTMELKAEAPGLAYDAFLRAITLNGHNVTALTGLSTAATGAQRLEDARRTLESMAKAQPDNADVRIELSHLVAASGDLKGAAAIADEAMRLHPGDPRAAEQLASVLADAGDTSRLGPFADAMVAQFPDRPDAHYYRGTAFFLTGRTADAIAEGRRVVALDPGHARAQNLLGVACATTGERECARAAFAASLRANPRDPSTYVNLGVFLMQTANPAEAAEAFAEALAIDSASAPALRGFLQARAALERR